MVNIRGAVERARVLINPKGEVGEIDTRAPIKSVRAAVTLYVEAVSKDKEKEAAAALNNKKSKLDIENVINKEAKLVLFRKAVESYTQLSQTDEKTLARAQSELIKAKKTLNELLSKLKAARDSKFMAIETAHFIEKQAKELEVSQSQLHLLQTNAHREHELDQEKEQYTLIVNLLDVSKQELTRIRQDFVAAEESKAASIQQTQEAESLLSMNKEKIDEMSKEIKDMSKSSHELTTSLAQIQAQISEISSQKDANAKASKKTKKELEKKLDSLRQECAKLNIHDLEDKLEETNIEIESLEENMRKAHVIEMDDSVTIITVELHEATKTLQELVEEKESLRDEVASLRLELENLIKERDEFETKQEEEHEGQEQDEIVLCKEHRIMHKQLSDRAERKKNEIAEIKKTVDKLKNEAKSAKVMVEDIKSKLEVALRNAEEAKSAKCKVYDELTEKQSDSPNNKTIKISIKEYEELKMRLEENENLAQEKEEDARVQVEVINGSKNETEEKLNEHLQSVDEIKQAIEIAVKSAQAAESAQNAIQVELTRLQQAELTNPKEQRKRHLALSFPKYETWKSHFNLSRLWQLKGFRSR